MVPSLVVLPVGAFIGLMIDYYLSTKVPAAPAAPVSIYDTNADMSTVDPTTGKDPNYYGIVWYNANATGVTYGPYLNFDTDTNSYYYSDTKVPAGFDPHTAIYPDPEDD